MTTSINFEVQGLKELQVKLSQGDAKMRITLNEGLRAIGRLIVPAKGSGPLATATPKRTGKLARSSFFMLRGGTAVQELAVMQPAMTEGGVFYGEFVREGTQPHVIRPVTAKALHFQIEGVDVFATRVNHPGTKANPYHKRVLSRLMPSIQAIVNKMGLKVTAYLAGK
jgi:hypothetical protein